MYEIRAIAVETLDSNALGGGDRVFIELFKRWQKKGIKMRIIVSHEGFKLFTSCGLYGDYDVLQKSLIEKFNLPVMVPIIYLIRAFKVLKKWNSNINNERLMIVYTPGEFICDVISAALLRMTHHNVVWVTHVHYIIPPPWRRKISFIADAVSFLLQRISFLIIRLFADLIIVVNSYVKNKLIEMRIPEEKIYKSSCGVDFKAIQKIPPSNKHQYDACFVGRLHPGKGTHDLIKIWSRVVKEMKNAKLAIVGGGSPFYINKLIKEIKENHLEENIHLLGYLPFPFNIMKSSKILLYPDHEAGYGWGIAIAEALACGIPVIAYNLPVYREVYEDKICLVKPWDIDEFAKKVINLLKDDEKRRRLGEIGREYVKKYDWDIVAEDLLYLLSGVHRSTLHRWSL
jgi:glycosyltransferase involved in cell wall biosynthesis